MSDNAKKKIQKLFVNNHYKKFLIECRQEVGIKYPGFWEGFSEQEQLTWLDQVVIDAKKLGFGNQYLIKGYLDIVCKIGKDFLTSSEIKDNLVRFITDSNFSTYVRVRDANRWIDKNTPKITMPQKD
ncbi:MAG: hypothetical protein CMP47_07860 [Rickettsiales bacterium]|nr:hypothetical protein [Rickettsiales bacterium]